MTEYAWSRSAGGRRIKDVSNCHARSVVFCSAGTGGWKLRINQRRLRTFWLQHAVQFRVLSIGILHGNIRSLRLGGKLRRLQVLLLGSSVEYSVLIRGIACCLISNVRYSLPWHKKTMETIKVLRDVDTGRWCLKG